MATKKKQENPKALLWLESSMTALHIKHMAQLSCALQKKGFEAVVLTSEDTLKTFEKNGGVTTPDHHCSPESAIDFGRHATFAPALASQTTFQKGPTFQDREYTPFEFIGSHNIAHLRKKSIEETVKKVKPDLIVTSLWPAGYGPFSEEIYDMQHVALAANANCRFYGLCNDIPYLDYHFNSRAKKREDFGMIHHALIRGDGSISMSEYLEIHDKETLKKMNYVGHFFDPLPPRTKMPSEKREVLVTYGTRESQWDGPAYEDYFENILKIAPKTVLRKQPWKLIIGPHCPKRAFEAIRNFAQDTADEYNMKIKVERGVPNKKFRQQTADAAFRICQYDIFVLDDINTGVPAYITTGNINRYTCGSNEGDDRLYNLRETGAHVLRSSQRDLLRYKDDIATEINELYQKSKTKKFSLDDKAPERAAEIVASTHQKLHSGWHPHDLNEKEKPDPVVKKVRKVEPATKQHEEERKRHK